MQTQRSVRIFGYRFDSNSAISSSGLRRITAHEPQKKVASTYHCRPAPDHKTACLRSAFTKTPQVAFKRIRREEVVRRLIIASCFSFRNQPMVICRNDPLVRGRSRISTRTRLWHISAIVDVARFRMFMSGTGDIFHPTFCANWRNSSLPPSSRIQMSACLSASRYPAKRKWYFSPREIFVVSRDKDIHRRPQRHIFGNGTG